MLSFTGQRPDRRFKRRFLIEQEVRYERLDGSRILEAGTGKTLDMSSGAVRFTTDRALRRGDKVKLAVNWPILLDDTCPLKMVIHGWVLRSDGASAAITIGHYELRTRAAAPPVGPGLTGGNANASL